MEKNPAEAGKPPVINCHTHIFTGDHVPSWLAKTFIIWPFYYLLPLSAIVRLFRWYYNGPYRWQFKPWYKKTARTLNTIRSFLAKHFILRLLKWAVTVFLTLNGFFILYNWLVKIFSAQAEKWISWIDKIQSWLSARHLLLTVHSLFWQITLVLIVILLIPSGRNLIFFIAGKLSGLAGKLPGKQTSELIKRYLTIGRHAFHKRQSSTFSVLTGQYPKASGFVVLPMDMEYMAAGKLQPLHRYRKQMEELISIKKNNPGTIFPFVFADPRRIVPVEKEINHIPGDKIYFDYTIGEADGKKTVELADCFIKDLVESNGFSGFKIYPALGYYPFDEKLLPLWKYAADNGLPILTHCIRGTIFYRGSKQSNWFEHPVFEEFAGKDKDGADLFRPLILPQRKNENFTPNFTHPLNYLCLLDESLLRTVLSQSADTKLHALFGYEEGKEKLDCNLSHLKICMGHFGGDDEWQNFFDKDRDHFSRQLNEQPDKGIDFFFDEQGNRSITKTEQVWKGADWYSIICSLMLQYENVYADISYILHQNQLIIPLLTQTLQNCKLRQKVLYGTDFFVVRNHKSDKEMLAEMMAGLSEADFDVIARENPYRFLENKLGTFTAPATP